MSITKKQKLETFDSVARQLALTELAMWRLGRDTKPDAVGSFTEDGSRIGLRAWSTRGQRLLVRVERIKDQIPSVSAHYFDEYLDRITHIRITTGACVAEHAALEAMHKALVAKERSEP